MPSSEIGDEVSFCIAAMSIQKMLVYSRVKDFIMALYSSILRFVPGASRSTQSATWGNPINTIFFVGVSENIFFEISRSTKRYCRC